MRVRRSISSSAYYKRWDGERVASLLAEARAHGFAVPRTSGACVVQALACDPSRLAAACEEGEGLLVVLGDRPSKRLPTRARFATVDALVDCTYALDANGDPSVR